MLENRLTLLVTLVLKILEVTGEDITLETDMPDTLEIAKIKFPCLISVEKDIYQPRLPSFKRKIETKDRQIRIICLNDMEDKDEKRYGLSGSPTQVERIFPPDENADKETWEGKGEELADRISEKLKELKFI